jgi:cytidylate kinase
MFRVVTLEREYGAGGGVVARRLAERLGWRLYDQQLTAEIARRADVHPEAVRRCDEHCDPLFYRLAKVFWRGSYERTMPWPHDRAFDTDTLVRLSHQVIEDVAREGKCVIVGRGSPYILRDRADVFSVFLFAPLEEKIARIAHQQNISEQKAQELVEGIDAERVTFIKHYFNMQWPTRWLYDLMVNTAPGTEAAAEVILGAMRIRAEAAASGNSEAAPRLVKRS